MIVGLTSIKGSPGVTSTALSLAAVWPRPAVLVEADPTGGDLAYRCKGRAGAAAPTPSVVTLATAAHARQITEDSLRDHGQELGCGVHAVLGVSSSAQAAGLMNVWGVLVDVFIGADVDVLVDFGRWDQRSPVAPLISSLDSLLVVARSRLDSILHLLGGLDHVVVATARGHRLDVTPVLIGPDATAERDCADLDNMLGLTSQSMSSSKSIAYNASALARLEGGETPLGRLGRSSLLRRGHALAVHLTAEERQLRP